MSKNEACAACLGCGACTFVCYVIGVIIGWVFSEVVVPDNGLAFAGAIVITIPVFAFVIATILDYIFSNVCCIKTEGNCMACAAYLGGGLSGVLDLVGVGLFIGAMVKAASEIDNPAGEITCGVFASIFVLAAAITNFVTICSLKQLEKAEKSEEE